VLSRDRFTCRYCARSAPDVELHVDHVQPVAKGGANDLNNLVAACAECNGGKSDKIVEGVPPAATSRTRAALHPLVGAGFISFVEGRSSEQGLILSVMDNGGENYALCQYFEWMMGEPTYQRLIALRDIVFADDGDISRKSYRLFKNNEARNSYIEWRTHGGAKFEEGAR
jgi:hypothetical protein